MNKAERRKVNLRNLRKARAAQRRGKRKSARRKNSRKQNSNSRNPAGMPVLLVNPERQNMKRRSRRRRRNSSPRRRINARRRRRRNPSRRRVRVHGYMRRRNPRSSSWKAAAFAMGLGLVGGGLSYVIDWGASYAPVGPALQATITGVTGIATSLIVCRYGNEALGAGIAGGTGAMLTGRIREIVAFAMAKPATKGGEAKGAFGSGADAVFRESSAVYREAGSMHRVTGARVQGHAPSMPAPSFKESGASRYIRGPIRFFGPRSWAMNEAGKVYRSAHDTPRKVA